MYLKGEQNLSTFRCTKYQAFSIQPNVVYFIFWVWNSRSEESEFLTKVMPMKFWL